MSVLYVNKNNFDSEVINSDKTVLLDFYADWCGPCRMIAPILDQIAAENPEIKVCKVNVDENPELATTFEVMSIPALFVMKDSQVVNQAVGAKTKAQLLEMLK